MTLQELFESEKLNLEMLENKSDESSYWDSCHKFVQQKWNDDIEGMTQKQANWASKIVEDLVELRIEGKL